MSSASPKVNQTASTKKSLAKLVFFELPFWALVISLVVAALITLALRFTLPKLGLMQTEIIQWLNERLAPKVNLGYLEGQMHGLNLDFTANNLLLTNQHHQPLIKINSLDFEIASLASLKARKLLLQDLNLDGLEIWLEQNEQGWGLAAPSAGQAAQENPATTTKPPEASAQKKLQLDEALALIETLLAQGELNLTNLKLHLQPLNEAPLTLEAAKVNYSHYADGWQFKFELANSQTPDTKAELLLNLEGNKLDLDQAKITAWLNLPQINLSDYQHLWPKNWSQQILSLEGSLALQAWLRIENQEFTGQLEAEELNLSQVKLNEKNNQFNFQQARLSFNGNSQNWQAAWLVNGLTFNQHQFSQLAGSYRFSQQEHLVQLKEINLNQLGPLAQELTLAFPYLHQTLSTLNPQGKLNNLRFHWPANQNWQLAAQLNEVGVNAWEGAPGGQRVNGYLEVTSNGGQVVFVSPELQLGFPQLYPFSWQASLAKGRVKWLIQPDDLWVIGDKLAIEIPAASPEGSPIQVSGEFAFRNGPKEPSFYLNLGLLPTRVTAQQQLVPSLLLPNEVADWLYNALPQGEVGNTGFIFAGPLANPRFELATRFTNTEFAFQPNWPPLKQAAGRFQLDDGLLKGKVEQAQLGEAQLSQASFATLLNTKADTLLNLNTQLATPTAAFSWLVANSPLKDEIPASIQQWEFGGQLTGNLKLGLNLSYLEAEPQVEITSQLKQASLKLSQVDLLIDNINGPLNFSLAKGFESSGLNGKLYGEFITAKFLQPANQLEFTSGLSANSLSSYLGVDINEDILNGYTLIKGELPLSPLGELSLTSSLYGLGYHLLADLNKHPNSNQLLSAQLNLAEDLTPLNLTLGEDLSLTAVFLANQAQLDFSSQPLQGQLIMPLANNDQGYQLHLDHLKLPAAHSKKQQPEKNLPEENQLTKEAQQAAQEETNDPLAELNLANLKPIQLSINQLYRGDNLLGSLKANLTPTQQGFDIHPLTAQLKDSQLTAKLSWQQGQHTEFNGQIKGGNLNPSFSAITSEPLPLNSKKHEFNWQLSWPASPLHFQLAAAQGQLNLNLADGNFPKTGGGVNTLSQMFSLLNIDSLFKRLKLDFSDVNKKGMTYSSIKGSYQLNNGLLTNSKPTEVKSSATRLSLTGEINLVTQELDQELKLVLPVAQSLPLAAVLVGAPQVGAGIWLTQKLFGRSLDKITQATYQVQGSLAEPEIKLKKVF